MTQEPPHIELSYVRPHTDLRVAQYFEYEREATMVFNALSPILKDTVVTRDMRELKPFAEEGATKPHDTTLSYWLKVDRSTL